VAAAARADVRCSGTIADHASVTVAVRRSPDAKQPFRRSFAAIL